MKPDGKQSGDSSLHDGSAQPRSAVRHLRWYIAGLLCLASALNYLDRQTLSVLIGTIKDELHLTNASYGDINAWFLVSYGVMYAVSGRIIDHIGTRRGFVLFVSGWSVANMLHVFASTVGQFSFFRCLLGGLRAGQFHRRGQGGGRMVPHARSGPCGRNLQCRHRCGFDGCSPDRFTDRRPVGLALRISDHGGTRLCLGGCLVAPLQTPEGSPPDF